MTATNEEQLIREVQSQAEARLQAMQQIALAADARAMLFGTVCVGIAAVVAAIASAVEVRMQLFLGIVMFVVAAFISFWSGRSRDWDAPGGAPKQFLGDIGSNKCVISVRRELLDHYDEMISDNGRILRQNGRMFNWATRVAMLAPLVTAVAFAAPELCRLLQTG